MTAKAAVAAFVLIPSLLYSVMFSAYVLNPKAFHFRAWEFFDTFVYTGFAAGQQRMIESGDSAREFLIPRDTATNTITVNEFGNRVACYRAEHQSRPRVLALGDSQLFGSGTDDSGTFPAQLCKLYAANVYNGSRRHGLSLLRVATHPFDSVIFTTAEGGLLTDRYCNQLDRFVAQFHEKIEPDTLRLPQRSMRELRRLVFGATKAARGYLAGRIKAFYSAMTLGPVAPYTHVIKYTHRFEALPQLVQAEVDCARRLATFFEGQGMKTGFLYFPAHQTMYGAEAGLLLDAETASFIDRATSALSAHGFRTLNTKACLNDAKRHTQIFQRHDSHLNAAGFLAIADCVERSDLFELVHATPAKR